jgi:hypothetical protein
MTYLFDSRESVVRGRAIRDDLREPRQLLSFLGPDRGSLSEVFPENNGRVLWAD